MAEMNTQKDEAARRAILQKAKASTQKGRGFLIPKRGEINWKDKVPVLRANAYEGCSGGGRDQVPPLQKDMFDSVSAR